jgi:hypothetical protein
MEGQVSICFEGIVAGSHIDEVTGGKRVVLELTAVCGNKKSKIVR